MEITQGTETRLMGTNAMARLDLYNEKLVDNGTIIGSIFDSFSANMLMIALLNVLVYFLIYYSLKKKDSI
tara:strand:+ start:22 stop:231 length:210 start_codon:yes stop_codon:yes gene_type:complete